MNQKRSHKQKFLQGRVGLTMGVFDLCHVGHIRMFEDCKKHCDYLIVAVQIDPAKGRPDKNEPIQSIEERVEQVKALRVVNEVITYSSEEELYDLLVNLDYDIRFMGSDWEHKQYTGIDIPGHSAKCYFHNRANHNFSSTELRERVLESERKKVRREFLED